MKIKILVVLSQFIYPFIFISPAIFSSTGTHMSVPNSTGGSDVLGGVRMAQVMQFMEGINVHSIWTAFPVGENLFPFQSLTQLLPTILLGILAQFFEAFDAINFLIVIAWAFTGTAGVFLLRTLGTNFSLAILGGLLIQFQPSMQFASVSVTGLLFIGFPLLICALMLKALNLSDSKQLNLATLVLIISAFTDGYVYYFGFICFSIMLIFIALTSEKKTKLDVLNVMLRLTFGALPIIGAYIVSSMQTTSQLFRKLQPPSLEILNINGLTPNDYLAPHLESVRAGLSCGLLCQDTAYRSAVGTLVPILVLLVAFLWLTIKKMWTRGLLFLAFVSFIAFLLSLRMTFNLDNLTFLNPTFVLVPLFPGALHLDRFSVLASALIVVIVVAVSAKIIATAVYKKTIILAMAVILAANLIDQNPLGTRELSMEYKSYKIINTVLELDNATAVVFSPYNFHGRRWLQQVYISLPMKNSLFDPILGSLPETTEITDAKQVACALHDDGVSHLISESGSNLSVFNAYNVITNDSRYFRYRASSKVPAYEVGTTTLDVFEIRCNQ